MLQTGKANLLPVVLIQPIQANFWQNWEVFVKTLILDNGWISEEDCNLYYIAKSPQDGMEHILQFYRRFHSYRYVMDNIVIRLNEPISQKEIDKLNDKYQVLLQSGKIAACNPFPEEKNHLDLFRLTFHHTRKKYGFLRKLFDDINLIS